ncbi:MAG: hypothetical protein OK455_02575 [Thaumarchaeota archaeon]|nr:hypothetical protein [Nitrososphaerota archaeon]
MRGPRHKRYLLLTSERTIDDEARKALTFLISKRYPLALKKAVWFERALIVKTDNQDISQVRELLEVGVDGVVLRSRLTSGSIGKLKKALSR